jgi:hypothetical protein
MFWRNRRQSAEMLAELAALNMRVKALEDFAHDLCNHIEDVEKRRPRIAHILQGWPPPDQSRPM